MQFVKGALVAPRGQKNAKCIITSIGEIVVLTKPDGDEMSIKVQDSVGGYVLYEEEHAAFNNRHRAINNTAFKVAIVKARVLYALSCLAAPSLPPDVRLQVKPSKKVTVSSKYNIGPFLDTRDHKRHARCTECEGAVEWHRSHD